MKKTLWCLLMAICTVPAMAQTITDGIMMGRGKLCTGLLYGHEQWTSYWEGTLERTNGNIGTLTTQSLMWMGNYGVTDRLNIIASLPYVRTNASGGTLHSMEGLQDLTLAAKYRFVKKEGEKGRLVAHAVGVLTTPVSNYSPDFLPLSIGLASRTAGVRLSANYTLTKGWFVNAGVGYTFRGTVTLDRPSYYTNNTFYETNQVKMYEVLDANLDLGYRVEKFIANVSLMQRNTQDGGDIRRQDMPFVSNRMIATRLGGVFMYYLPKPKNLAVRATATYVIDGRNVGRSAEYVMGFFYTLDFGKSND